MAAHSLAAGGGAKRHGTGRLKRLKRREFITRAVVAGTATAAAAALAAPAIAQGTIIWRMVHSWPRGLPGVGVGAERLAQRITAMSGGRLQI